MTLQQFLNVHKMETYSTFWAVLDHSLDGTLAYVILMPKRSGTIPEHDPRKPVWMLEIMPRTPNKAIFVRNRTLDDLHTMLVAYALTNDLTCFREKDTK